MMKIYIYPVLMVAVLGIHTACTQKTDETNQSSYEAYGVSISNENARPIGEISSLMNFADTVDLTLTGTIEKTCSKKGCWMTVDVGDGNTMRVTFKDYGFFVPKNGMEGKTVVFQGKAIKTTTSIEDLRHFAEDGGATDEEIDSITEPKEELTFIAEGVLIKS